MPVWSILAQQLAFGIVNGFGYVLLSIGLTLIFGIMNIINFAHGEFYMFGAFVTYTVATLLNMGYIPALILSTLVVGIFGMITEKISIRPLRERHELTLLLATLALSIMFVDGAQLIWDPRPKQITNQLEQLYVSIGPIYLTYQRVFIVLLAIVLIISLHIFLKKTLMGKLLRATAQNRDGAALVGINIDWVYNITFGLGCALAGISGSLLGSTVMINPHIGQSMVLKAFIVVILAGLGSIPGAVVGGLGLGLIEAIAAGYVSIQYKDLFGYTMLIIILLIKPSGLFGEKKI